MSNPLNRRSILYSFLGSTIALFGGTAVAAVGPTLKCTRVGQKIIFRGYSYSCIKYKGALIWKKGAIVPVTKATPSPSPSETVSPSAMPSPSATASPTPSPTPVSKGVVIAQSSQIKEGATKIIDAKDNSGSFQSFAIARFNGKVNVLSTVCTHQGCLVQAAGADLECPCHGAQYNGGTGAVQRGPATRALTTLRSLEENGEIILLK